MGFGLGFNCIALVSCFSRAGLSRFVQGLVHSLPKASHAQDDAKMSRQMLQDAQSLLSQGRVQEAEAKARRAADISRLPAFSITVSSRDVQLQQKADSSVFLASLTERDWGLVLCRIVNLVINLTSSSERYASWLDAACRRQHSEHWRSDA